MGSTKIYRNTIEGIRRVRIESKSTPAQEDSRPLSIVQRGKDRCHYYIHQEDLTWMNTYRGMISPKNIEENFGNLRNNSSN